MILPEKSLSSGKAVTEHIGCLSFSDPENAIDKIGILFMKRWGMSFIHHLIQD